MLHGTDISAFQASTVPAGDFVIIKATQGTGYVNGELEAQLADARRKKMLVGFYHFPEFGNDPLADARHFCDTVAPLLQPGDKVILDHEAYPPPNASHASAWGLAWLPYTEHRFQRLPWVYANLDWAANGYCAGMGRYPYWCADPGSPAGQPRVRGPFKNWIAHQYSSSGGIDRDVFNGTRADWLGAPTPTPTSTEDDMPSGNFNLKPGEEYPIIFDHGKVTGLALWADTSFEDKANGITAEPPQLLRIAVLDTKGNVLEVHDKVAIGRAAGSANVWAPYNLVFKNKAAANCLNITRQDAGTKTIGFCLY